MSVKVQKNTLDAKEQRVLKNNYKYWAFISYKHKEEKQNDKDEDIAIWLHKALETYRVPKRLVGKSTSLGLIKRRINPIFIDKAELGVGDQLENVLKKNLSLSRYLIVICSPKSAKSSWVNEEISYFQSLDRENRVFCIIVNGIPSATLSNGDSNLECFPNALINRKNSYFDPLAIDLREGKDDKKTAKLKIISGLLEIDYDELKRRETIRAQILFLKRGLVIGLMLVLSVFLTLFAADSGGRFPLADKIRGWIDSKEISFYRPVYADLLIKDKAKSLQSILQKDLKEARGDDGWYTWSLDGKVAPQKEDVWGHSQVIASLLKSRDLSEIEAKEIKDSLQLPFNKNLLFEKEGIKYGWIPNKSASYPNITPALWIAYSLALLKQRENANNLYEPSEFEQKWDYTVECLNPYYDKENGSWSMFPFQISNSTSYNPYTTTLALLVLLEAKKANLSWNGSTEKIDELIKKAAQWLINSHQNNSRQGSGWLVTIGEAETKSREGLNFQIYAVLLKTEEEYGITLPEEILDSIPKSLEQIESYESNHSDSTGNFVGRSKDFNLMKEEITFLWYPWALELTQRWLRRLERLGSNKQGKFRRIISHLIMELGDDEIANMKSDATFRAAETFYCLNLISN